MALSVSRKILSVFLTIILSVGGILFTGSGIAKLTLCNENYISMIFSAKAVNNQCRGNFLNRVEVISAKSGIPSEVFESVLDNDTPEMRDVIQRLFDGNDTSLYNEALVEQFETLCTEYLEDNNITYNKEMVHNTAVCAAEIYSDCFGLKNTQEAMLFVEKINADYGKYASVGMLLIAVSIGLFLLLYKKKGYVISALCFAFTAQGILLLLIGICGLILGIVNSPAIVPDMYANVISKAVDGAFAVVLVIGALITALAAAGAVKQCRKNELDGD